MLWFLYIRYFLDFICRYILFDRWENVEKKENLVLLENVVKFSSFFGWLGVRDIVWLSWGNQNT